MIGIASTYPKEDKTRVMVQRRGGSDDCEHEFGGIREKTINPQLLMSNKVSLGEQALRHQPLTSSVKQTHLGIRLFLRTK